MIGIITLILITIGLMIWLYFDDKNMTVLCYHCGKEILIKKAKTEYASTDLEATYYHYVCNDCHKEIK